MTIVTVENILAAMLEKKIADVKADFAKNKGKAVDQINAVLVVLGPVLDKVANEATLREARLLALRVPISHIFGESSKPLVAGAMAFLREATDEAASKREKPMTRDEIIKTFGLSSKAVVAFDRGATIGELFVIQPDLFL